MAQWRRCTNAAALRFGRTYYLLTIVVALALWLCDQHFCVHLHSLLACHSPQSPSSLYGGADGPPRQPTKACGSPEGRGPPQASGCGQEGCTRLVVGLVVGLVVVGPTWTPALLTQVYPAACTTHSFTPGGIASWGSTPTSARRSWSTKGSSTSGANPGCATSSACCPT